MSVFEREKLKIRELKVLGFVFKRGILGGDSASCAATVQDASTMVSFVQSRMARPAVAELDA